MTAIRKMLVLMAFAAAAQQAAGPAIARAPLPKDEAEKKALDLLAALETVFVNKESSGVGITLKKR